MASDASTLILQFVATVGVGAISGGLTNAVAIWMLFHPYEPRRFLFLTFHGAIPKNKERLARSIGKTVGERLLTPEDLERQLTAPGLREAFERALNDWLTTVLTGDYDSPREFLPPAVTEELERAIAQMAPVMAERFVEYSGTDDFRDTVRGFVARQAEELKDRPVADVLTDARQEEIKEWASRWVDQLSASEDFGRAINDFVGRQVERLATDPQPLLERLPPTMIAAVESGIRSYLPHAIERLAGLLARPDTKDRVKATVHNLIQRFSRDLQLHEKLIARLVMSEKTVGRLIDAVEKDGADQISRLLEEPAMQTEISRAVNDAVVSFLRRPLRDHFRELEGERLEGLKRTAADYVLTALRDPGTRNYAIARLDQALEGAERRTWGELLALVPPEKAAAWLQQAARGERVRGWIAEGFTAGAARLLERRIGRPSELLPPDGVQRLVHSLNEPLWNWIRAQVPLVVAQLSVREMVEEKVRGFSIQRMEEIVRGVTQRELDLIVKLGYVLGGFVGMLAFGINLLVSALR